MDDHDLGALLDAAVPAQPASDAALCHIRHRASQRRRRATALGSTLTVAVVITLGFGLSALGPTRRATPASTGAGDATEDLAQEAMARTLARWRRVRRGTNPAGYVYTTAFRLLQRHHRRARPERAPSPTVAGPEAVTITNVVLTQTLDAMPPARRAVAALCISLGWTTDEAATALRISPSTSRVQLHRARNDLRSALGEPAS
jgi:RNA polymerase sigma factor (sigma-70 family)